LHPAAAALPEKELDEQNTRIMSLGFEMQACRVLLHSDVHLTWAVSLARSELAFHKFIQVVVSAAMEQDREDPAFGYF